MKIENTYTNPNQNSPLAMLIDILKEKNIISNDESKKIKKGEK